MADKLDRGGVLYYLPDTAEPVVQVEIPVSVEFAIVLGQYLAVGVDIGLLYGAVGRLYFHKYHRQISHNIDDILTRAVI